jgi:anti-sigma B factor antagonist
MYQAPLEQFRVEHRRDGVSHTLGLEGELDLATCSVLDAAIQSLCADGAEEIVLDLSELSFVDSSGLRTVLTAIKLCEEHRCEFALTSARPQAQRLFSVSGLLDRLPFRATSSPAELL